jgi:hypothetical protein
MKLRFERYECGLTFLSLTLDTIFVKPDLEVVCNKLVKPLSCNFNR